MPTIAMLFLEARIANRITDSEMIRGLPLLGPCVDEVVHSLMVERVMTWPRIFFAILRIAGPHRCPPNATTAGRSRVATGGWGAQLLRANLLLATGAGRRKTGAC